MKRSSLRAFALKAGLGQHDTWRYGGNAEMGTEEAYVLLAETDEVVAQLKERELRGFGYDVARVSSGEDAAKAITEGERSVLVLLIDAALGNSIAESPEFKIVLGQEDFAVLALVGTPGARQQVTTPSFDCHGCVVKDCDAALLDTSLKVAVRLFRNNQKTRERKTDLENAASQAQLGLWEFSPSTSVYRGSDTADEILGLMTTPQRDFEAVSQLYDASKPTGLLRRAIDLTLNEGKPFSLVSEIQTPSGNRKWVRTRGQLSEDPRTGARKVLGTLQDISEIRLLDRITQESEMTLNQVEQITHIGHWSVSLVDGAIYHSDEIKRIFGYEPSEYALSVEEAINAYHPDDRDELLRLFNRAVETGEGYEFDLRVIQPNSDIRHVHSKGYTERDETGKATRVYGVLQDITEQVLAEQALRESEESMKALVDGVHTAIVVHDKNGQVLLSNQMANRLLAPHGEWLVGKGTMDPAWRFIFEDGNEVPVDDLPVSRILRTQKPVENLVIGRRTGDNETWMLINGVPVLDKQGVLSKVVISFVDITEHREMEERLHQAEKMKATGQLAGGVAHDFNNQLMVMLSFAELLKEALKKNSIEASWVDGILSGVSHSAELTRQLLAFARKGKYVVTTLNLNALISEVVSMAQHSFPKKIRISQQASALPATIAGDASQLQNALLNMALNSRDAMPEGGELVFTIDRTTLNEQQLKNAGMDVELGECVKVTIQDTGHGMDASTKKHVFEPFFTTKGRGKGTGMGMASVYGTVKNHHGAIEVESEPGEGTKITMYFPLSVGHSVKPEDPLPKVEQTGGRVMVIDDDEGIIASLSIMLTRNGYQAVAFSNSRDAIEEFKRSWRNTDLVLLDMIMPEMTGVEAFNALKVIDPDVRVILISGFSFTEEANKIREAGAAGFLVKPVTAGTLLQTISDAIRTKRRGTAPILREGAARPERSQ